MKTIFMINTYIIIEIYFVGKICENKTTTI